VTRPGYGIGLGTPQTMQLAIDEVGAPRILFAAAASAVTKPFGIHGVFYRLAGPPGGRDRRSDRATPSRRTTRRPPSAPRIPMAPHGPRRGDRRAGGGHRRQRRRLRRARREPRASTAASSSGSSPTTRSGRRASRPRSASFARSPGRRAEAAPRRAAAPPHPALSWESTGGPVPPERC
jgi:hypothetical protein